MYIHDLSPAVTSTPPRLRPKGPMAPEVYRQCLAAAERPKQSAVERLEADKAKYVKSQVALSKQQPVRHAEMSKLLPSPRSALKPTRKAPIPTKSKESIQLDLEHLSNLISDVNDGPQPRADEIKPPEFFSPQRKERPPPPPRLDWPCPAKVRLKSPGPPREDSAPCPPAVRTVRRVDVMPQWPSVTPPSPAFTRRSSSSARKRPSLTRSKSDLSDRFSRADTELERFFNLCGLDPSDLRDLTASNSDIVSLARFRSVSAPGSECAGSGRDNDDDDEEEQEGTQNPAARVPYGISVIERNARVIKWLYGLRQSKDSANKSTNL
uniref:Family with sequence similarity 110 member A n=1 Tax=Neogobius melanostomus TaxID=47308 RepID=A0A8C6T3X2_9GOBI